MKLAQCPKVKISRHLPLGLLFHSRGLVSGLLYKCGVGAYPTLKNKASASSVQMGESRPQGQPGQEEMMQVWQRLSALDEALQHTVTAL